MPNGRFHPDDIARLHELGAALNEHFGEEKQLSYTMKELSMEGNTQRRIQLQLPKTERIAYIELRENIANGQRVEMFRILKAGRPETAFNGNCPDVIYSGYTIGNRKICPVNVETDMIEIQILSARDTVELRDIILYKA